MWKRICCTAIAVAVTAIPNDADAALNAYLKLKGQKTGDIKGSVTQKGREGKIQVIAFEHELKVPVDAASGLASGKRTHQPLRITKELDKSTPLLQRALVTNEAMAEFELQFFSPKTLGAAAGGGMETQHFTIKLTGARIVSIRQIMPNNKNTELSKLETYEEVSLTYQHIEWIWTDGNVRAEDSTGFAP